MKRLKKFLLYAVMIAGLWLFSDILIYISLNSTYKNTEVRIYTNSPEIIVGQSRATYINGYITGSIKNNTDETINRKYLKIDMYSPRNVKLGTKYVEIDNLKSNEYTEFKMWYKFTDVEYVTITTTDNVNNASEEEFISQETATYLIFGTLLVLYFI